MVNIDDDAERAYRESMEVLERYYGAGNVILEKVSYWLAHGPPEVVVYPPPFYRPSAYAVWQGYGVSRLGWCSVLSIFWRPSARAAWARCTWPATCAASSFRP